MLYLHVIAGKNIYIKSGRTLLSTTTTEREEEYGKDKKEPCPSLCIEGSWSLECRQQLGTAPICLLGYGAAGIRDSQVYSLLQGSARLRLGGRERGGD